MFKKILFIITLSFNLFYLQPLVAQGDTLQKKELKYDKSLVTPVEFNEDSIKNYAQDDAFDYIEIEKPDTWWTRFNKWISDVWNSFLRWLTGGGEVSGFLAFLLKALPYLLVLGVLILFIWLFAKVDLGGSPLLGRTPGQAILNNEQEIIENQNIQALIDEALNENNYRLAIRYYYLLLLQTLSKKDLIDWQLQKTNHDYIHEIQDGGIKTSFSKVTRIYDFIWYGSFEVDEEAFAKAEKEFKNLQAHI